MHYHVLPSPLPFPELSKLRIAVEYTSIRSISLPLFLLFCVQLRV